MTDRDRPLPKPPSTAFGKRRHEAGGEQESLLSDRMAAAIAEGRLEEFLKEELPDSEEARSLAMMMMGMTGMLTPGMMQPGPKEEPEGGPSREEAATAPPGDVFKAVQAGDVQGLMGLLKREHEKRASGGETASPPSEPEGPRAAELPGELPAEEKETLNKLAEVARQNNVTIDWVILRALKLYIREYQKTGRL